MSARPSTTVQVDGPFRTRDEAARACVDYAQRLVRQGRGRDYGVRVERIKDAFGPAHYVVLLDRRITTTEEQRS